jgi:hypothetical protein
MPTLRAHEAIFFNPSCRGVRGWTDELHFLRYVADESPGEVIKSNDLCPAPSKKCSDDV